MRVLGWVFASAVALALILAAPSGSAEPLRGADRKEEFAKQYRMGDEADEQARVARARQHKAEFSTPEQAFRSWQASIVRSSKEDYLACLHPDFRAKEYPDGARHYIKNVDYIKYWYLAMYATYESSEIKEDAAELRVTFSIRNEDGTVRKQRVPYKLQRHEGRWLFASR